MGSYRDLRVWQSAMALAAATYRVTDGFPKHELYGGLAAQLRRAALSVPSNIAEGKGRRTAKDFTHFLFQARGSLLELETQLLLATELQYISEQETASLLNSTKAVGSALTGLINALRAAPADSR
ncbi:MAG: four helix bundle protein [Terriglobales bacterium]